MICWIFSTGGVSISGLALYLQGRKWPSRMIEEDFDVPFVAKMALREKQVQQNYRPVIAVHKWFARRPGTLFRGLLLAEFGGLPVAKSFYSPNDFAGLHIADPFMGGGTPLLEANRLGCDVTGFDINPMAYWVVKQEIEHLKLADYDDEASRLMLQLRTDIGGLYDTTCEHCGMEVPAKYFLWVKVVECWKCGSQIDLFPGYLLAKDVRHPKCVYVCSHCGRLNERSRSEDPGNCSHCGKTVLHNRVAARGKAVCRSCGEHIKYPQIEKGPPKHRLFAIEYHCKSCRPSRKGRLFKSPDEKDLSRVRRAEARAKRTIWRFIPDDDIPEGDETNRLHRWGYNHYRDMFNARQLLGLELSCRLIAKVSSERVRNALATNLSDLLRYQNMLCRYDPMALKSLDVFSIHGFPVGLVQCESNLLGIKKPSGAAIGSGGWVSVVGKFRKAKEYCDAPFEIEYQGNRKRIVPIPGEWIGDRPNGDEMQPLRQVDIRCADAATQDLPKNSLDAVFTDPPYFGNVQYAELMDFCYVWLRRLIDGTEEAFNKPSTRVQEELTGNATRGRGLGSFAHGLSNVFQKMSIALKPGRPLAFTFHHNKLAAYAPVAVAVLDADLICTAALPCPAEMHGSIHINGTKSSIVDTVFVCRATAPTDPYGDDLPGLIRQDLAALAEGGRIASEGDALCVINGRLTQAVIAELSAGWQAEVPIADKLIRVRDCMARWPTPQDIKRQVYALSLPVTRRQEEATLF